MTQPIRRRSLVPAAQQDPSASVRQEPVLHNEFLPLAPVPASSEPSIPPPFSEKEAIRVLVLHYGWCPIGGNELRRYRRHGSKLEVLQGGRADV